jgi:dihydroxyacetone kinase
MLRGLVLLHPGSVRLSGHKVIVRVNTEQYRDQQVAVLSGGGSGHEPAHAGYIGIGMLSAAVVGEVFTSPSSDSVFAAIKAVAGERGASSGQESRSAEIRIAGSVVSLLKS